MKNIIFFLSLLIFFSCEYDQNSNIEIGHVENYDFENNIEISSIDQAFLYTAHLTYKEDIETDYCQTPEETYILQTGDCEDISLMLMFLLKNKLNINSELCLIEKNDNHHALVYIPSHSEYVDIIKHMIFISSAIDEEIIALIPYPEAIWMAVNYHKIILP